MFPPEFFDSIVNAIASRVVDSLRVADLSGWVDQAHSPLGRRKHIALVRQGKGRQVGRKYYLPVEVVSEAMANPDMLADLGRKLGNPGGKRRRAGRASDVDAAMGAAPASKG